jgi:hypothetical protein
MFTQEERTLLRSRLLDHAATDQRISGAAITGSGATAREDRWSDIDLAFGVTDASDLPQVLADWTARMYAQQLALHHTDVKFGAWIYRVFLLPNTMQIDLGFVAATEFRALAPAFRIVFGEANPPAYVPAPTAESIIGLGWLYALHARSSIARGNFWQAEYMISGVRDNALGLACIRNGLPALHGRGIDRLPTEVTAPFEGSLVRQLESSELVRAFRVVVRGLIGEIRSVDGALASRLQDVLTHLTEDASLSTSQQG